MRRAKNKRIYISILVIVLTMTVIWTSAPFSSINAENEESNYPGTQTGYRDVIEAQRIKWNAILKDVFGDTVMQIQAFTQDDQIKTYIPSKQEVQDNEVKVQPDNKYFDWKKLEGITPWNGTKSEVVGEPTDVSYASETITGGDDKSYTADATEVIYNEYDVETAEDLRFAMEKSIEEGNVRVNLLNDIDLNGKECLWEPIDLASATAGWLDIEGNGHTIYNMKSASDSGDIGFIGRLADCGNAGWSYAQSKKLIIKNLNFSNCLVISEGQRTAVVVGYVKQDAYFENVNVKESFVYSGADQTGTLIGRTEGKKGSVFIRNCSSSDCYVFGANHSGGLTGCQFNRNNTTSSYKGYKISYDAAFPNTPEVWMNNSTTVYSEIVENSYSVGCELYSLGKTGDSGGFLSCGSKLICRNCFTNNHVYGNTYTGAFFGRITSKDAEAYGLFDDAGNQVVGIYFENCYASGSVEGNKGIGGFVAFDDSKSLDLFGVFKNCYTTAMVGMDYAGTQLGGFIGYENTKTENVTNATIKLDNGSTTTNSGAVYINCYAAGEVGNIQTDTDTTATGDALGGFLGEVNSTNGNYVNCYYDMQTTAMRERACGVSTQFQSMGAAASQIPGVTGVYTLKSDSKNVSGLADDVRFDGTEWEYNPTYYPQLKCFKDQDEVNANFVTVRLDNLDNTENTDQIRTQLNEKAETVKKYSQASAATVLLNHWDSVMNMDTGTLGNENDWEPGIPDNEMKKDTDGWYKLTYENLTAGEYEFKIQEGTSWSYNFGRDKYDGSNCVLKLDQDNCDVTIRFKYDGRVSDLRNNTNFSIFADIYKDGGLIGTQELGKNEYAVEQGVWTIVGDFGTIDSNANWNPGYTDFDMSFTGDDKYALTSRFPAGTYEFKVTRDHMWTENYGQSGERDGTNMTFTLSQECDVGFTFDEETHLTTVTASPVEALTLVQTEKQPIQFTGVSVIAPAVITGHDWLDGEQAAIDGEMIRVNDKYVKTFTVKDTDSDGNSNFEKIYGYKIIKDANDVGQNSYFRLLSPTSEQNEIEVTFTYDPVTGETGVTGNIPGCVVENPQPTFYGVLGVEGLTGHDWEKAAADGTTASQAGEMKYIAQTHQWIKTYNEIPAGTYAFKIAGEGTFASGIDFGANDGSGNYIITTNKESDITIVFNKDTNTISVSTSPEDALEVEKYVISGTESLTGENWNTTSANNTMDYNEHEGTYSKAYENLTTGTNYVFKVVKFGLDNNSDNICFCIEDNQEAGGAAYKLVVEYYPKTKKTEYHLYDENGVCVDEYMKSPEVDHYSVIGEKDLTGFNWLGENNADQEAADAAGRMQRNSEGIWTKTFADIPISSNVKNVGFKVVMNGTWDSGISYGGAGGNNYLISLSSQTYDKCNVTITFNENTHVINVTTEPEGCNGEIDEDAFKWYVTGTYKLVSGSAYTAPTTVYDTVRDITSQFEFTSDGNLSWEKNDDKNTESRFFERLGDSGFNLEYTVDGNKITGTFNEPVITLAGGEEENGQYTPYECTNFMPGKQWLSVSSVGENGIYGRRDLRLIPTAYLEAGNAADIYVLQAGSDTKAENVKNVVRYRENSISGITFDNLTSQNFSYYNLALTAGYVITDRTGLGYYGNYSKQTVQEYKEGALRSEDSSATDTYYAMSSAFCEAAEYDDSGNYIFSQEKIGIDKGTTNLYVDTLRRQSLVGNSYYDKTSDPDGEEKNAAKTIVKIYKKVEDENGTQEEDGKKYSYLKVFMDSNNDSTSEYHTNYLKWTGQQAFDVKDEGTYFVMYYWSLADGRFLSDSKKVYIKSNLSKIEKLTEQEYIEKSEATNTIEYTVNYTNGVKGNFTIYDVLPYNEDKRYDDSKDSLKSSSAVNSPDNKFEIMNVNVECDSADVSIDEFCYTDTDKDKSVKMNTDGTKAETWDGITWSPKELGEKVDESGESGYSYKYSFNVNQPATAFKLSGTQSNEGTSHITITYTVQVPAAEFKDSYINNAFFNVTDSESSNVVEGYSNPVTTAVVGRGLSGYAWFDSNVNSIFDANEAPIQGIKVVLMKKVTVENPDGTKYDTYKPTDYSKVTDEEGYYEFPNISFGTDEYRIQFEAPDTGKVTVKYSKSDEGGEDEEISYEALNLSPTLSEYTTSDKNQSRNIAREDTGKKYYINETVPNAQDILKYNGRSYLKGSIDDYYFSKIYQNLGLTDEELIYSITIKKVNEDEETLSDVTFKLEYFDENENIWIPVANEKNDNGEFITDDTGTIFVEKLPKRKYRITELKTQKGYNLLSDPIEVELPYAVKKDSESSTLITTNKTEPDSEDEGYNYYNDVTFKIINTKSKNINDDLPLTGRNGYFGIVFVGIIIAALGIGIIIIIASSKKSNQ